MTIREFDAGLQVEITVGYDDDVLPMSAAIQVILEEGLNVVSCTSSRSGDRYFHHNLICEVMSSFSPFELISHAYMEYCLALLPFLARH